MAEGTFVTGDVFPGCSHCGKKLKWRRVLTEVLPIDTIETGVKRGLKKGKKSGARKLR